MANSHNTGANNDNNNWGGPDRIILGTTIWRILMGIYEPLEDSYFFAEFLEKYISEIKDNENLRYLDVGTGSGILLESASKFIKKKNIYSCDINQESVDYVRKKGFKCVRSDLFSNIKGKFDIITFNAPYLPEDKNEPKDSKISTTGGKRGDEISVKFLREAKKRLKKEGRVLLLISSLTPIERIKKFNPKIVAKKRVFMEDLFILEFKN